MGGKNSDILKWASALHLHIANKLGLLFQPFKTYFSITWTSENRLKKEKSLRPVKYPDNPQFDGFY